MDFRSRLALLAALLLLPFAASAEAPAVGVVLMHGKWGTPQGPIQATELALKGAGAAVISREMPWSDRRAYDAGFDQVMGALEADVARLRAAGARIKLIADGDVSAAISTCFPESGVDVLMGTGGAPEGVIAAAALRCCGGDMQGRLAFRNDQEIERAKKMGITDTQKIFALEEMAKGNVIFAATGVTSGDFLKGVRFFKGGAATWSVVMRSKSQTIRYVEAQHSFEHKPGFAG